jgi:hypothetical protein
LITNRPLNSDVSKLIADQPWQRNITPFISRLSKDEQEILQQICIIPSAHFEIWNAALWQFAKEYGANPDEIAIGIGKLISDLTMRAAGGIARPITLEEFQQAFTSYEGAKRLTIPYVLEQRRKQLDVHEQTLWLKDTLVRRELLEQVLQAAH